MEETISTTTETTENQTIQEPTNDVQSAKTQTTEQTSPKPDKTD